MCLHCAQPAPPPGGPVDNTAPTVLATDPPDGAFGVSYPLTSTFYFSEKMHKRSVERDLRIYPEPDFLRIEWEEGALTDDNGEHAVELLHITLDRDDRLTPRPTTITVGGGSEDGRKNAIEGPVSLAFTNGQAPLPLGRLAGRAEVAEKKRTGLDLVSITVEAYRVPAPETEETSPGTSMLAETEEAAPVAPYAVTSAGRDGQFLFRHLPLAPERVRLRLYRDDDQDGVLNREVEYYGFSDTLALTEEGDSITIRMVNVETPAELSGTILWASPESLSVELTASGDSLEPETTIPDSTGAFAFRKVAAGSYELRVLRQAGGGGEAPSSEVLDTRPIDLAPGEQRTLPDIGPPEPAPDETMIPEGQNPQVKE